MTVPGTGACDVPHAFWTRTETVSGVKAGRPVMSSDVAPAAATRGCSGSLLVNTDTAGSAPPGTSCHATWSLPPGSTDIVGADTVGFSWLSIQLCSAKTSVNWAESNPHMPGAPVGTRIELVTPISTPPLETSGPPESPTHTFGAGVDTVPVPAQIIVAFVQSPMFRIGSAAVRSCAGKLVATGVASIEPQPYTVPVAPRPGGAAPGRGVAAAGVGACSRITAMSWSNVAGSNSAFVAIARTARCPAVPLRSFEPVTTTKSAGVGPRAGPPAAPGRCSGRR